MLTAAPTPMQGKLKAIRLSGGGEPLGGVARCGAQPIGSGLNGFGHRHPGGRAHATGWGGPQPGRQSQEDSRRPVRPLKPRLDCHFCQLCNGTLPTLPTQVRRGEGLPSAEYLLDSVCRVRNGQTCRGARSAPPRAVLNVDVRRATPSSNARGQPRCSSAPACEMTLYCPGVIRHGVEAPAPGNHCRRWRQHHPVRALWRVRTVTGEAATTGLGGRGGGRLRLRLRQDG